MDLKGGIKKYHSLLYRPISLIKAIIESMRTVSKRLLAEELHKPVRRKFEKHRVLVNDIDKIWAADLADMQAFSKFNRGIKYLLAVIDVFSKYGWLIPLKDKTGKSVASALKTVFKERKPEKMWVDKDKEFYNKDVKS